MTINAAETLRNKAYEAAAGTLWDAYDCRQRWSAWGEGTMQEDDFLRVAENPARVLEIADAVLNAVEFDAILKERDALRAAVGAMHNFLNRNYRINGRCIELDCESHNQAWDDLHETKFIVRAALELQEKQP